MNIALYLRGFPVVLFRSTQKWKGKQNFVNTTPQPIELRIRLLHLT
jgi:hypothetical protein